MGNSIRSSLKKLGCKESIINRLFATNFQILILSIEKGDLETVRFFYLTKKVSFSEYLPTGDSPLHVAVTYNQMPIVKYIVEEIVPLNIEDKNFNGDTPLMLATLKGNLEMVTYLVETAHADINTRENRGATPFFAACCNSYLEILSYFLFTLKINYQTLNYEGQSPIHRVSYYGLLSILKYLRKNTNLSFSSIDKKGNSPLHLAAMRLNIACLRYLMRHSSKKEVLLSQKNLELESPVSILMRILNKIKDPGISEITKEEIIKYINDKTECPAIRNAELNSKLRGTLLTTSQKKNEGFPLINPLGNGPHLKIPLIQPFPGPSYRSSNNVPVSNRSNKSNMSPKILKINSKREHFINKVTPLITNKNISNQYLESETPKEEKNLKEERAPEEIKSVLIRKRDKGRGKKTLTPSPDKFPDKKGSPNKIGSGSPFNKWKRALIEKFNSIKPSFLVSPNKRKKLPALNVNKPVTKGLSFREMNEKFTLEEGQRVEEKESREEYKENSFLEEYKGGEMVIEEEKEEKEGKVNIFSLFKGGRSKSPLNNNGNNYRKPEDNQENLNSPHLLIMMNQKNHDMRINIPEDSIFSVLKKGRGGSEREIGRKLEGERS